MKSVRGNLRVGHETVGTIGNYVTLKEALAEIDELVEALEPFCNIEEKADYSYGEIRMMDVMRAEALIAKHKGE